MQFIHSILHTYSIKMKKQYAHNYRIVNQEITLLSEEEKEKQAYFKGYKSYLGEKIMEARDKEELIDILQWLIYKVKNNDGL